MNDEELHLPYGRSELTVQIGASNLAQVLRIEERREELEETEPVQQALAHPIGSPRLRELARPGHKVVILTSDLTRPCPSRCLLPPVLDELLEAGIPNADMTIVIALGLHRPMTVPELEMIVGPRVFHRLRVVNHDTTATVRLGTTSAGTPVELYRPVAEADLRVCLGNLEFHYFAGYSGGAKAILPGCASEAAITANHSLMAQPGAVAARLEGNPVRADLEECAAVLGGANFILNVVLDGNHRIAGAVAGDITAAHRQGCELVNSRYLIPIPELADIVLVSAGGHPKDVNLYQAQKALDNAAQCVRQGGVIVLVAECSEGFGNQTFESWLSEAPTPDELLRRIEQRFVLGGHKAAAMAAVLKRAKVFLVSALAMDSGGPRGLVRFADLGQAMMAAFEEVGATARVLVMPHGNSILPILAA